MDYKTLLIVIAALAALILWKKLSQISAETAQKYLKEGALVIDVRSSEEYRSSHFSQAVNVPLDQLEEKIPLLENNKSRVLLLHCLSGTRSGIAQQKLRAMGYLNAFNLGSFERAKSIVTNADKTH
jgi:phage shock protein E